MHRSIYLIGFILLSGCFISQTVVAIKNYSTVITGAQQFNAYVPQLKNRRVGIVTNITGVVGRTSIVDTLIALGVNVRKIFGPEHGFRGDAEAAEKVAGAPMQKQGCRYYHCTVLTKANGRAAGRPGCAGLRHTGYWRALLHLYFYLVLCHGSLRRKWQGTDDP